MADSEQVIFEATRTSAGYQAREARVREGQPKADSAKASTDEFSKLIAKAESLGGDDKAIMQRYMDGALRVVAHKKTNPDFAIPPHFCTNHGLCYHDTAKCNANKGK